MTDQDKFYTVVVPKGSEFRKPREMTRVIDHFRALHMTAEFVRKSRFHRFPAPDENGNYTLITHDARDEAWAAGILARHFGLGATPKVN